MATTKDTFLSTAEVAGRLEISQRRVNALIKSGKLKAQRIGHDYLITKGEFAAFLRNRKGPGRPPTPKT